MSAHPKLDPEAAVKAHKAAFTHALALNDRLAAGSSREPVAGAALYTISHDALCLHQAIGTLAFEGWAFATPLLLRTLLEGLTNAVAITNSSRPNLAGFKYFYFPSRETERHKDQARPELLEEMEFNVKQHLEQLSSEDQTAARAFLTKKGIGEYWFTEEFDGITDLLKRFAIADVQELYRRLSDAVHFGFIGMRLYRDEPDVLDVGPRRDIKKNEPRPGRSESYPRRTDTSPCHL